jgi:2-dehydro-3-deoxyphosphooctonate aldolase (KDO 8-P synthase)
MTFLSRSLPKDTPFFLIAGPCVIESEAICLFISQTIKTIAEELNIPAIFKASFDKANRTSSNSFRGPGIDKGLEILAKIKQTTGLPVVTDIHEPGQAELVAQVCDVIQIPAFLCRQTDLVESAARTGKPVNIKKSEISPWPLKSG